MVLKVYENVQGQTNKFGLSGVALCVSEWKDTLFKCKKKHTKSKCSEVSKCVLKSEQLDVECVDQCDVM